MLGGVAVGDVDVHVGTYTLDVQCTERWSNACTRKGKCLSLQQC